MPSFPHLKTYGVAVALRCVRESNVYSHENNSADYTPQAVFFSESLCTELFPKGTTEPRKVRPAITGSRQTVLQRQRRPKSLTLKINLTSSLDWFIQIALEFRYHLSDKNPCIRSVVARNFIVFKKNSEKVRRGGGEG